MNRASCYFALDQWISSIQDSEKAITFAPKCLTSHQNIFACKLALCDKRGSCKAIEKCRLLSVEMAEALDTLKKAYVRLDVDKVIRAEIVVKISIRLDTWSITFYRLREHACN